MQPELDIVIPVYNEGRNIVPTLTALVRHLKTPARVLICYDHDEDDTLPAIRANPAAHAGLPVEFVRNRGRGAHSAVMTGFDASSALFVLMYPADDDTNAAMLDAMIELARGGCDIVCASRFLPGGAMVGCPPLKAALVRAGNFTLHHVARLPSTDASPVPWRDGRSARCGSRWGPRRADSCAPARWRASCWAGSEGRSRSCWRIGCSTRSSRWCRPTSRGSGTCG
jgi:glycosyltransferase involved in cell wall biosynthesis